MNDLEAYEWLKEEIKKDVYKLSVPVMDSEFKEIVTVDLITELDEDKYRSLRLEPTQIIKSGLGLYPTHIWQWGHKLSVEDVELLEGGLVDLLEEVKGASIVWDKAANFIVRNGFMGGVGLENDVNGLFKYGGTLKVILPKVILLPQNNEEKKIFCILYFGVVSNLLPKEL